MDNGKWNWLEKARKFALNKHKGQLDDSGKDYFDAHIMQVFHILENVAIDDIELLCAALLHDTIEDTDTTYDELLYDFGKYIADLVMEVTHDGTKDEGYFFPRLHSQKGIILKFADRLSNISRMEAWDDKRKEHYLKRSKFWKSGFER